MNEFWWWWWWWWFYIIIIWYCVLVENHTTIFENFHQSLACNASELTTKWQLQQQQQQPKPSTRNNQLKCWIKTTFFHLIRTNNRLILDQFARFSDKKISNETLNSDSNSNSNSNSIMNRNRTISGHDFTSSHFDPYFNIFFPLMDSLIQLIMRALVSSHWPILFASSPKTAFHSFIHLPVDMKNYSWSRNGLLKHSFGLIYRKWKKKKEKKWKSSTSPRCFWQHRGRV